MATDTPNELTLRPHGHLYRQGGFATLAFMTPLFIVLYVMTIPDGPWLAVLVTHALTLLAIAFATISFFRVSIRVSREGISEVGFFGRRVEYPIGSIGSVLRADVVGTQGEADVPQLFVRAKDGTQLVRMRGQFWSLESMNAVVRTLGVREDRIDDTVSTSELRTDYPGLLYWFERHPLLAAIVFSAGTAVVGAVVYGVFHLIGS